jgi:hypothetical protein
MDWKGVGSGIQLVMGVVMDPRTGGKGRNLASGNGKKLTETYRQDTRNLNEC